MIIPHLVFYFSQSTSRFDELYIQRMHNLSNAVPCHFSHSYVSANTNWPLNSVHVLHTSVSFTCQTLAQAGCLKKVLYLLKGLTECACFAWRGLEVLIPACEHRDSVMTLCSALSHLCLIPRLPLSILCYSKKALNTSSAQLKKQHCWRMLILRDYMAGSWHTKGLWMGGKWST